MTVPIKLSYQQTVKNPCRLTLFSNKNPPVNEANNFDR